MPRDPNVPDEFDVYTLVLLRRPADVPVMPDEELDALQARHLAYRAELVCQGVLVANGPLGEQSDVALRGLSIFACDLAEAARLSDGDPSVQAGRLGYDLMEWWVAAGTSLSRVRPGRSASAGRCPRTDPPSAPQGLALECALEFARVGN
jgi:uncharacterized protein YciI